MKSQAYKRVVIPQSELPPRFGRYQRYVLTHGHLIGVLDGMGHGGGAYSDPKYRVSRQNAVVFAKRYGVIAVADTRLGRYFVLSLIHI